MKDDEDEDWYKLLHPKAKGKIWYRDVYLKSDHWLTRTAEFKKKNKICLRCGNPVQVTHHVRYRAYNERDEDLEPYCWKCHRIIEAEKRLLAERRKK